MFTCTVIYQELKDLDINLSVNSNISNSNRPLRNKDMKIIHFNQ